MNNLKPSFGVEFTNEYDEAKRKFFDFLAAMNKLSPAQKEQLAKECMSATGTLGIFQQFINFVNYRF